MRPIYTTSLSFTEVEQKRLKEIKDKFKLTNHEIFMMGVTVWENKILDMKILETKSEVNN